MAYCFIKSWTIPLWTKLRFTNSGKTIRCCVGAVATFKRDFLASSFLKFHQGKMDARKIAGEGDGQEDPAVSRFREYLRIMTVHPDPDYGNVSKVILN